MYKIKENIKLVDLEKFGFRKILFDISKSIPEAEREYFYVKYIIHRNDVYYIETNHVVMSDTYHNIFNDKVTDLRLIKVCVDRPNKTISFSKVHKISRIALKYLLNSGIIEKVGRHKDV